MNKKSQGIRQLPLHGIPQPEIMKLLKEAKTEDADWEKGRIWGFSIMPVNRTLHS
jgi:hypothetical protein